MHAAVFDIYIVIDEFKLLYLAFTPHYSLNSNCDCLLSIQHRL